MLQHNFIQKYKGQFFNLGSIEKLLQSQEHANEKFLVVFLALEFWETGIAKKKEFNFEKCRFSPFCFSIFNRFISSTKFPIDSSRLLREHSIEMLPKFFYGLEYWEFEIS